MTYYSLCCYGFYYYTSVKIIRKYMQQSSVNNGLSQKNRHLFMSLAPDCHSQIMHQTCKDYSTHTVLKSSDFFNFKRCSNSRFMKNIKHFYSITYNLTHMNRTVVIKSQSADGNIIRILLHFLQFFVCK